MIFYEVRVLSKNSKGLIFPITSSCVTISRNITRKNYYGHKLSVLLFRVTVLQNIYPFHKYCDVLLGNTPPPPHVRNNRIANVIARC
jgi:hypothetical protein